MWCHWLKEVYPVDDRNFVRPAFTPVSIGLNISRGPPKVSPSTYQTQKAKRFFPSITCISTPLMTLLILKLFSFFAFSGKILDARKSPMLIPYFYWYTLQRICINLVAYMFVHLWRNSRCSVHIAGLELVRVPGTRGIFGQYCPAAADFGNFTT